MGENPEVELFNLYRMMDSNGSNELSRYEVQIFLEAMGITFSQKRWHRIFREIDHDYDDSVSRVSSVLSVSVLYCSN